MSDKNIRIGIVGAGANTRLRHIPGFRAIPGVEITGIVNSTAESTARAARDLKIARTYPDWQTLVADPAIDAICIGTWPNLHCEITCAALAVGKHVLTEARMARNVEEARRMLAAADARPQLVAQIVPSPFGLVQDAYVQKLMADGYLNELREIVVIGADDMFWDYSQMLHWRQDAAISGYNTLALGILHETVMRWTSRPTQVFAQASLFEPTRPSATTQGQLPVTVPDSLQIVAQLEGGARAIYHFSGIELFGPGKQIHLYGRSGTVKYVMTPHEELWVGRAGDKGLTQVEIPVELRGGWRVEAEFIGAIRGEEIVKYTTFRTGLQYMEFTEAVARSAATNLPVTLPLHPLT